MKQLLILILLCTIIKVDVQGQQKLTKIWETDSVIATPESVLPDLQKKILYVSLIDGAPWDADGKGGIAVLNMKGEIVNPYWVKGLGAPKGLGLYGNKLYAADITKVVIINVESGKIEQRLSIEGAKRLNDVTIDSKGTVYVSDSETGKVYKIENGKSSLHLSGFAGLNGLKAVGDDLLVLAGQVLYKVYPNRKLAKIASGFELGGDGIEPVKDGGYIVSCWGGLVYYVSRAGKLQLLMDSRDQKINTADIGYNPDGNIIYIPTFFKKSVAAYSLR